MSSRLRVTNEARLISALRPNEQAELAGLLQILLVDFESSGQGPDERLGLTVSPAHVGHQRRAAVGLPPPNGLLVESVRANGPAAAAGVQPGDLLVQSGDRELRSLTDLALALSARHSTVTFRVHRSDKASTVRIQVPRP
jgi:serine protease Do